MTVKKDGPGTVSWCEMTQGRLFILLEGDPFMVSPKVARARGP